jgi:hypothetical protein
MELNLKLWNVKSCGRNLEKLRLLSSDVTVLAVVVVPFRSSLLLPYSGQNNNPSQFINIEMYLMSFCSCFNSRSKALCVSRPSHAGYIFFPTHSKIYTDPVSGMSCGGPAFSACYYF